VSIHTRNYFACVEHNACGIDIRFAWVYKQSVPPDPIYKHIGAQIRASVRSSGSSRKHWQASFGFRGITSQHRNRTTKRSGPSALQIRNCVTFEALLISCHHHQLTIQRLSIPTCRFLAILRHNRKNKSPTFFYKWILIKTRKGRKPCQNNKAIIHMYGHASFLSACL